MDVEGITLRTEITDRWMAGVATGCDARVARHMDAYFRLEDAPLDRDARTEFVASARALPYAMYLQTPWWRGLRLVAIRAANGRCQLCNTSTRLQVHHRTYARLGEEELSDLTVLCGGCHDLYHRSRPR